VKVSQFTGSQLPADWSTGIYNYGYQATLYQPSQVTMSGTSVSLTAINKPAGGYPYQSGWITTAGRYSLTHGMIDFYAKMPAGQGLWSGLWAVNAQGSKPQGEIDVQEMLLANTHQVFGSLHGWNPTPQWGETQATTITADASQAYHHYQVIWQPGMLTWAIDGTAYAQYTKAQAAAAGNPWPFDTATGIYLIANLAVAAPTEWGGAPNTTTTLPATMNIQSVQIWQ
jgi:beta-glucanase (GH16 family)